MGIVIGLFPTTVVSKTEGTRKSPSVSNDLPGLKIKFTRANMQFILGGNVNVPKKSRL